MVQLSDKQLGLLALTYTAVLTRLQHMDQAADAALDTFVEAYNAIEFVEKRDLRLKVADLLEKNEALRAALIVSASPPSTPEVSNG